MFNVLILMSHSEDRIMLPFKRTLKNKSLDVKCKALIDLENGTRKKDVAAKYSVPRDHSFIAFTKFSEKLIFLTIMG